MKTFILRLLKLLNVNSINKKFSFSVITMFVILIGITTFLNSQFDKYKSEKDIINNCNTYAELAALSLTDPMWNFNQTGIKDGVDSLFNVPEVYIVVVTDQENKEIYKRSADDINLEKAGLVSAVRDIEKDDDKIGAIEVKVTRYYESQKIRVGILRDIMQNIVIIALLFILITFVSKAVTKPLKELISVSEKISAGDYSCRASANSNDEVAILSNQFNNMAENISNAMSDLKETSSSLESYVSKLKTTYSKMSEISTNLSSSSSDVASSTEELNATIEEIASNANMISQVVTGVFETSKATNKKSDEIAEITKNSKFVIESTIKKINSVAGAFQMIENKVRELNKQSSEIKSFTDKISSIANQTNLISLNAAIEAARAGELGRGFSVVADEVRKLSDQSTAAVSEINRLVHNIDIGIKETVRSTEIGSREVKDGVKFTEQAGEALDKIDESINGAILMIRKIGEMSKEADVGVRNVADSCEEFAKAIEHVVVSSQDLSNLAVELNANTIEA